MTDAKIQLKEVIDGFEPAKPFVFAGLYPIETDKFEDLREALNKLKLNDSSISLNLKVQWLLEVDLEQDF